MPDDLQREIFGGSDDDDLSSEEGTFIRLQLRT